MIVIGGKLPPPFFTETGADFPNQQLLSLDDEQVKAILLALGVGELFASIPPREDCALRSYLIKTHPTHWLSITRFENHPREADNGYTLQGWPKSMGDSKWFAEKVVDFLEHMKTEDSPPYTISDAADLDKTVN